MRRIAAILTIILSLAVMAGAMAAAAKDVPVKVYINGAQKDLKPAAFMRGSTVYLPLTATASAVGATVKQAGANYTITAGIKTTVISKSQGIMVGSQLMVPMNIAASALNCNLRWNAGAKSVYLTAKSSSGSCPPAPAPKPGGG